MYEILLEQGKIQEFARAVQSTAVAHQGPSAIVTPTFLTTGMLTWEPEGEIDFAGLGLDPARVLHAEEEYVFHGGVPACGQALSVTARLGAQYEKQGRRGGVMRFAEIVHEFRDGTGVLVAEQHTTLVETGQAPVEA